jgi:IS1 family transposase
MPNCPSCESANTKKNGHTHNTGKQNHICKDCGRNFVENPEKEPISNEVKSLVDKLLLERIPFRGISRVVGASLRWVIEYAVVKWGKTPGDLGVQLDAAQTLEIDLLQDELELDEQWSFVGKKANKQWLWLAMDRKSRKIIAFHVGDRSAASAKAIWEKIPESIRNKAKVYTDDWEAYKTAVPSKQHFPSKKKPIQTI